jgi:hypothetical protein
MLQQLVLHTRRTKLVVAATMLGLLSVVPAFMPALVHAAPAVTERELQSLTARPGQTNTLTWIFDTSDIPAVTENADHIEIEFCDSPLASCSNVDGDTADPSGGGSTDNIPLLPASPTATLSGPWTSTGNTASRVDGRQAATAGSGNQITIDKTTADDTDGKDELQIQIAGFTNDDVANRSFYTRMRIYSDAGTTLAWEGVFAQSTSQTLTVNARVQERLDFCVGADDLNDATSTTDADTAANNNCADVTGSAVDIGNVENGFSNVSPVTATNGGDGENGIAMVRTNAFNGVVVDYKSLQDTSSGTLKVPGAQCSDGVAPPVAVSTIGTDRCFNTSNSQSTLTAGTEEFGMTIAGVNCGSVTAYSCVFTTGAYNLVRDAAYDGTGANTFLADADQVAATTAGGYAWEATTAADRIAGSSTVVDDEALILKFAATAGVTTPTGAYTVQADFIATATF